MWDSSLTEQERPPRRSLLRFLPGMTIGLLSVGLAGCLIWHPDLDAAGWSLAPHTTSGAVATTPGAGGEVGSGAVTITLPTLAASPAAVDAASAASAAQLDAMVSQLQAMQRSLQGVTQQLDQRYPPATPPAAAMDAVTMLAEIERLNQVMQPLMQQIEAAIAEGRPQGEIAAMRTQMTAIHNRLAELMDAVQAARGN